MKMFGFFLILLSTVGCAGQSISSESQDEFKNFYLASYPKFAPCYASYGNAKPVQIWIAYQTNSSGEVSFADIEKSGDSPYVSNDAFDQCALKVFRGLNFPAYAGVETRGTRGKLPILFPTDMKTEAPLMPDEYQMAATKVIRKHEPAFRKCYAKHGDRKPLKALIDYRGGLSGEIVKADVDSGPAWPHQSEFNSCLSQEFTRIHLPPCDCKTGLIGNFTLKYGQ